VLPAYNESAFIADMVTWTIQAMEQQQDSFEIVIVDNASTDETRAVVTTLCEGDPRLSLIVHETNRLYAGSVLSGTKAARGLRIFVLDSDGQHDPADIWKFDAALDAGASIAFGWRRHRSEPKSRLLMSKVLLVLSRLIIGYRLHDVNCGIRGYTREFGEALRIEHQVNLVNPELYVRAVRGGFKIGEVEVVQQGRKGGISSHNFRKLPGLFFGVVGYLVALRRLP
jgi:dolichol-phosphate mannosyltransferase